MKNVFRILDGLALVLLGAIVGAVVCWVVLG